MISLALGIAEVAAPYLARWLGGEKAEEAANEIVGMAKIITGQDDGQAALDALKADPTKQLEFQKAAQAFELGMYEQETRRLETINKTMRVESTSKDKYVARMRPTFGYIMAFTWLAQMLAVAYVIAWHPERTGRVVSSIAELTALWGIGLSVLGIYVYKRSSEKMGIKGAGPLQALGKLLGGRDAEAPKKP